MTDIEIILNGLFYIALAVTVAFCCAQDEDSFLCDDDHLKSHAGMRSRGVHQCNRKITMQPRYGDQLHGAGATRS